MGSASIQTDSLAYIILNTWVPAAGTVVLGGTLARLIIPAIQRKSQRSQLRLEKKNKLCEDTTIAFGRYTISWARLIKLSDYEKSKEEEGLSLSDEEAKRKADFVRQRTDRRDALYDSLRLCKIYFSKPIASEIDRFMSWDDDQSARALEDLASVSEWKNWERRLVEMLVDETI